MRTWEDVLLQLTVEDAVRGKELGVALEINDGIVVAIVLSES